MKYGCPKFPLQKSPMGFRAISGSSFTKEYPVSSGQRSKEHTVGYAAPATPAARF